VGYGQNKTDDLPTIQKGQIGYLEGKFNIYKGHKDQAVKNQKDIDVQIAKLELESKKRELRLEMTDIASQMVFLHKLQSILDEELKTTQTQKQMASKKVAAGLTSTVDNLEFQLRENEIQIEQKQIDQQHEEAHQRFMKLYGEDIADTGIGRLDFSDITLIEKIVKTTTPLKIEDTVDYQKAKLSEDHLDLEKKEIKSEFLPSVDFTYSVGRLTPSEDTSVKYNENKYALQVTVPLFSGYDTYYKTKAAALSLQAAERSKNQKKNDLISDFNTVKIKISELIQLFQINEIKLFTSQSYFDMTLSEYRRGVKNSPDLVSATERLFSTKKKKLEILKELEILKVKFENYYLAPLT
jgi:outer membrane protein